MFCPNCGEQIPDNAKFCAKCGGQVAAKTAVPDSGAAKGSKKKKPNLLLVLIVVGVCFIIGRTIGGSMADSYVDSQDSGNQSSQGSYSYSNGDSASYNKVFSDRNIVVAPAVFFGLDSNAYVNVDSDGYIDHFQVGYKDDVVEEIVETVYMPVEGLSDADKQALDEQMMAAYGQSGLYNVSVSSNIGYSYYSFTITITDLDSLYNVQAVVNAGLLTMDESNTLISMSATESDLLSQGYIKK